MIRTRICFTSARATRSRGRRNCASPKGKDNLYVCSILAVKPDTGELKWYFQMVPGDSWDFDSVQQMILADLTIKGQPRKVIMQANKNGFYYVIDRITGQFISGQPYSHVTWAKGLNEETGRPMVNPEALYGADPILISPGGGGAHNWSPMSFNPVTGLIYIPTSTANSFTYAMTPDFSPKPGQTTGTVRPAPTATRPPPPSIGPEPSRAATAARWSRGIRWRSKCAGACPAAAESAEERSPLRAIWCFR